jgi:hypothetical protein
MEVSRIFHCHVPQTFGRLRPQNFGGLSVGEFCPEKIATTKVPGIPGIPGIPTLEPTLKHVRIFLRRFGTYIYYYNLYG